VDPRRVHRDDERGDTAVALRRVRFREHHGPGRTAGVGDEGLGAVQDVFVAASLRRRLHARDVGSGVGLAQTERAEDRLLQKRRQPRLLLLVGSRQEDGACPEAVREDRGGDAGATPVELLPDEHAVEGRELGPAERLRDVEVHEPQLVSLRDDVRRMRRVYVVLGRLGPYLLLGELACERAKLALLGGQRERDAARDAGLKLSHDLRSWVD
jgi:hypothetical protein